MGRNDVVILSVINYAIYKMFWMKIVSVSNECFYVHQLTVGTYFPLCVSKHGPISFIRGRVALPRAHYLRF
jgi:hypothetical protein